jgi:hypothetical protein
MAEHSSLSKYDPTTQMTGSLWSIILVTQGMYYLLLGVWPIIDIRSFQAVSGPKTDHLVSGREEDHWLVITVGGLIAVIGFILLVTAWRRRFFLEIALLGASAAVMLAIIDMVYVFRKVIAPIYLADAAVEMVFLCGWIFVAIKYYALVHAR